MKALEDEILSLPRCPRERLLARFMHTMAPTVKQYANINIATITTVSDVIIETYS